MNDEDIPLANSKVLYKTLLVEDDYAVSQTTVQTLGASPAQSLAALLQVSAHAMGLSIQNAVNAQQQQNTLSQAAANQGVMQIYSLDTTAAAGATEKVAQAGVSDNLTSLLTVLKAFS